MRKIACLVLVLLLASPAVFAGDETKLAEGQAKVKLDVTGMTCGACCTKLEAAMDEVDGIVKIKADFEKGVAMVVYEKDKIDVKTIVETINSKTSFKAKEPEETS